MHGYKVSIRLMTYQHEATIRQALDSILMQETDFPVEVVIGDDLSTDGTPEIIRSYASTEKIHLKVLDRHQGDAYWTERQKCGRLYNFEDIVRNCSGRYIALLDGDDYWLDPLKLQKQVDFLDAHPDAGMVYTDNLVLLQETGKTIEKKYVQADDGDLLFERLLMKNHIPTPTVMVRSGLLLDAMEDLEKNIRVHKIMDYPLWLSISRTSKIGHIPRITAVYRQQEHTASRPDTLEKKYDYIRNVHEIRMRFCELAGVDPERIREIELNYYRKKLFYAFREGDRGTAEESAGMIRSLNGRLSLRDRLKRLGTRNACLNGLLKKIVMEK